MYTVKQAAALTGIPGATLRAWERRYAVVEPDRSAGGYRRYDERQLADLRAMAQLVNSGVPASLAAAQVRQTSERIDVRLEAGGDLVDAARSLDPSRMRGVVDQVFASGPFEQVVDQWLMPQLARLGDAWQAGELTVAHEHFASAHLMRAIAAVFDVSGDGVRSDAPVLVGLPPGAHHELAVFCFATCLRRLDVDVIYLGSNVPVEDWVTATKDRVARGAVLGVTMRDDLDPAQDIVTACARLSPPISLWVGGPWSGGVRSATVLPDGMAEAARLVQRSLAAGAA